MHRPLRLAAFLALATSGCFGTLDPEAFDVPRSEDHADARDGEGGSETDAGGETADGEVAADGTEESAVDVSGEAGD